MIDFSESSLFHTHKYILMTETKLFLSLFSISGKSTFNYRDKEMTILNVRNILSKKKKEKKETCDDFAISEDQRTVTALHLSQREF